ncbi:hypothetical protein TARUN_8958 [Trichoderma arundinaceum]|uniref:Uncharacterized protein n=1 Tax=Trichoderma arundinaceum TaxID=490622 RepID=A0A395NBV2_TRIAR|nr:hypothetical protein TARUN_8958 [Trichoderma arundinaceum]
MRTTYSSNQSYHVASRCLCLVVMSASQRSGAQRRSRRGGARTLWFGRRRPAHGTMGGALVRAAWAWHYWLRSPLLIARTKKQKQQNGGEAGRTGSDEEGRGGSGSDPAFVFFLRSMKKKKECRCLRVKAPLL